MACHAVLLGLATVFILTVTVFQSLVAGTHLVAVQSLSNEGRVYRSKRQNDNNNNNVEPQPADIVSMIIDSKTSSRYTLVQIHSVVVNNAAEPREAEFLVQIPEMAFISNFSMLINGTWLMSTVMEKKAAEKAYEDAQKKGESAGHVSARTQIKAPRGMDNFGVNINVAAKSEVEFVLLYTQLLERRLGSYEQQISVRPGQIVPELVINAELYEPQGFSSFMFTPPGESVSLYSSRAPDLSFNASTTFKTIKYSPSVEVQQQVQNGDLPGVMGDFVIKYDVVRETPAKTGGLLVIDNGYFVHYLSPSDESLPPLDKNVAFVIDVSGSMSGRKISQTKEAMVAILDQLRPTDYFSILLFSSEVIPWKDKAVASNAENIEEAKNFVRKIEADGGTNIEAGLRQGGMSLTDVQAGVPGQRGRMIVFLTDGMPSAGVTNTGEIRSRVRSWNSDLHIPIFSLGFGEHVSFDFLQQISIENNGFARKIYYDIVEDAGNQLSSFFTELETIILLNIKITYDFQAVVENSLTTNTFPQYFLGTELIIAGELTQTAPASWNVQVTGDGKTEAVQYDVAVSSRNNYDSSFAPWSAGFAEKIRAYLKIRDLVRDMSIATDDAAKESLRKEALNLSLHYNFVTPVTSMVITQSTSKAVNPEVMRQDLAFKNSGVGQFAPGSTATKFHVSDIIIGISLFLIMFLN